MGKAALLAIAALVVMGAYYGMSAQRGMLATNEDVADYQYEVVARNAALAGFNLAKQELATSFSPLNVGPKPYGDGSFKVDVSIKGSNAEVVSRGKAGGRTYTIYATIEKEVVIPPDVPAYLKHALLTEKDLTINGNVSFDTIRVAGTDDAVFNANIHTNGKLTVKGNAASIRGFGTYVTTADVKHPNVFKPYSNDTGEPVIQKVDKIDIPTFDMDAIAMKVGTDSVTAGDVVLSGSYDFSQLSASRENPYVWHVKGNLSAVGNTQLTGYVMFLVEGNINFTGNVQVGTHEGPAESNYAFYCNGNIEIGGNAKTLWGQMVAAGDVTFHGTPRIYGNVVAGGMAKISGTPDILFVKASPALTAEGMETTLKMISYAER